MSRAAGRILCVRCVHKLTLEYAHSILLLKRLETPRELHSYYAQVTNTKKPSILCDATDGPRRPTLDVLQRWYAVLWALLGGIAAWVTAGANRALQDKLQLVAEPLHAHLFDCCM